MSLGLLSISEGAISGLPDAATGYTLSADGATYAYAGGDATLVYGRTYTLSADGATYAYTGGDATFILNRVLAADGATYAYTGGDAALVYGRNYTLSADGATYAYAGGDATFTRIYTLAADGGAYAYTGGSALFTALRRGRGFYILHNGALIPPSGNPPPAPNTFAITATPAPAPRTEFPGSIQWQSGGVDLGEPNVRVMNFIGAEDQFLVTRGTGEQSNVITVRKLVAPPPTPVPVQWDPAYLQGPGIISNVGRTFSETSDTLQTWTRSIGVIPAGQLAYWEIQCNSTGDTDHTDQFLGIRGPAEAVGTNLVLGQTVVFRTQGSSPGTSWQNYRGSTGATLAIPGWGGGQVDSANDRYFFAFDSATGRMWFGRNSVGGWLADGDPAAGLNPIVTDIPAGPWHIFVGVDNDDGDNTAVLCSTPSSWLGTAPAGFSYVQGP